MTRLVGVIVELFDSNSIDERARISSTLFCTEAGEVSVNDGVFGRVGVFEAAITRDGIFLDGAEST